MRGREADRVAWGDLKTVEEVAYELYVLYFDATRRLLYINNSANDGVFEDLAAAVAGEGAVRFTGSTVYRVMADIDRLIPNTVGVLDAHDQFRRFSMHVGADVTASFSQAEAGTKSQTNISGGGYRGGERVNISASLKGRIWSQAAASSLKHWRDWCDSIGDKLLDDSITIEKVIGKFILPVDADRPPGRRAARRRVALDRSHAAGRKPAALIPGQGVRGGLHRPCSRQRPGRGTPSGSRQDRRVGGRVRSKGGERAPALPLHDGEEVRVVRPQSEQPLSEWLNEQRPDVRPRRGPHHRR